MAYLPRPILGNKLRDNREAWGITDLSHVTNMRMLFLLFHLLNCGRQSKVFTNFPRKDR
jgi:hypothetical protein